MCQKTHRLSFLFALNLIASLLGKGDSTGFLMQAG